MKNLIHNNFLLRKYRKNMNQIRSIEESEIFEKNQNNFFVEKIDLGHIVTIEVWGIYEKNQVLFKKKLFFEEKNAG